MADVNPYFKLVRMLEQRQERQKKALVDTESQLMGARDGALRWDEEQNKKSGQKVIR